MKRKVKVICVSKIKATVLLLLMLILTILGFSLINRNKDKSYLIDFQENTEERFIELLAINKGQVHETAKLSFINKIKGIKLSNNEEIRFVSINKFANKIRINENKIISINLLSEICYVYNISENSTIRIIEILDPVTYTENISNVKFSHGEYDISINNKDLSAKISTTGVFKIPLIDKPKISGDIKAIDNNIGITDSMTVVLLINKNDFTIQP